MTPPLWAALLRPYTDRRRSIDRDDALILAGAVVALAMMWGM